MGVEIEAEGDLEIGRIQVKVGRDHVEVGGD